MTTSKIPCTNPTGYTATGLIHAGPCVFNGFLLTMDGTNDTTVTIYNNITNSGQKVVPATEFDASLLGINGALGMNVWCNNGLYIVISVDGGGACEVVPYYLPYYYDTALGRYMPDKDLRLL